MPLIATDLYICCSKLLRCSVVSSPCYWLLLLLLLLQLLLLRCFSFVSRGGRWHHLATPKVLRRTDPRWPARTQRCSTVWPFRTQPWKLQNYIDATSFKEKQTLLVGAWIRSTAFVPCAHFSCKHISYAFPPCIRALLLFTSSQQTATATTCPFRLLATKQLQQQHILTSSLQLPSAQNVRYELRGTEAERKHALDGVIHSSRAF